MDVINEKDIKVKEIEGVEEKNVEITEEEKLYEIEKKLGRHEKRKLEQKQQRKTKKFTKYFLLITNMVYILTVPILLMIGFYIFLKRTILQGEKPLLLVIFIVLGAITGYWSLIKELMKMNKMEDSERNNRQNDNTK